MQYVHKIPLHSHTLIYMGFTFALSYTPTNHAHTKILDNNNIREKIIYSYRYIHVGRSLGGELELLLVPVSAAYVHVGPTPARNA